MPEVSQATQKLISRYQDWHQSLQPKEGVSIIHIDEVASKVASFYEKMRGVIDWREEHLLRKTAIERMLKRRLFLKKIGGEVAEPLVCELIRGGHFPNNFIPETKITELQKLIDKYIFILENAPSPSGKPKTKTQLYDWLLGIAACEVEEILSPSLKERALIEYMTEIMRERIEIKDNLSQSIIWRQPISNEEKDIQIYIAVQRALFKLDSPIISYHLLKKRYPQWANLSIPQLQDLTQNIYLIWNKLEKDLKHPLSDKIYKVCERYDTPYLLLNDVITENPMAAKEKIFQPEALENFIKKTYNQRLKTLKSRLRRAAVYTTVSIFLSNVFALLAIEIPFTKYVMGQFYPWAIVVNILGPTFLMFFLVATIRPPKKGNLEQVIMEVMKIVYERKTKDVYEIKISKKRGVILNSIIVIFYLLAAAASFGVIIWGLYKLHFPPISYPIFIIFVCLIAFAGTKIRGRSKELHVTEEKGTFLGFLIDLFSLPILQLGNWLSTWFTKHNAIVVLFNSLLDMPFQAFIEFLEQWGAFLKEKREKIH